MMSYRKGFKLSTITAACIYFSNSALAAKHQRDSEDYPDSEGPTTEDVNSDTESSSNIDSISTTKTTTTTSSSTNTTESFDVLRSYELSHCIGDECWPRGWLQLGKQATRIDDSEEFLKLVDDVNGLRSKL